MCVAGGHTDASTRPYYRTSMKMNTLEWLEVMGVKWSWNLPKVMVNVKSGMVFLVLF